MAEEPTDGSGSAEATPDSAEDRKRKFREADRKKANASGGSQHKDGGRKQGSLSTGPAESRREFRRKSV